MLMRFDPFRELDRLTQELSGPTRARQLPMDAYRRGDTFMIHFDVPGVDPAAIELTVEKDVLTVKAERRWPAAEGDDIVVQERPQGPLARQVFLGAALDTGRLAASCADGVLTIRVPVAQAAKAHKVPIATGTAAETQPAA